MQSHERMQSDKASICIVIHLHCLFDSSWNRKKTQFVVIQSERRRRWNKTEKKNGMETCIWKCARRAVLVKNWTRISRTEQDKTFCNVCCNSGTCTIHKWSVKWRHATCSNFTNSKRIVLGREKKECKPHSLSKLLGFGFFCLCLAMMLLKASERHSVSKD